MHNSRVSVVRWRLTKYRSGGRACVSRSARGFTVVEVLLILSVVLILAALVVPMVLNLRDMARVNACRDRMRQIGLALHSYHDAHRVLPPGAVHMSSKRPGTAPDGDQLRDGRAPWSVIILPFLNESERYERFDLDLPFSPRFDMNSETPEPNRTEQYRPMPKFQCPTDPNSGPEATHSNYAACQGGGTPHDAAEKTLGAKPRLFFDNGVFFHNSSTRMTDIRDGLAMTVVVGESKYIGTPRTFGNNGAWWSWAAAIRGDARLATLFNISATCDPINNPQEGLYNEHDVLIFRGVFEGADHGGQQRVYGSWHPGGANFLFADASVRFLYSRMETGVYRRLGTKADGLPEVDLAQ